MLNKLKFERNLLWNYIGYGFSLGTNVFLLPIVLKFLTGDELGIWYVFMSVGTLVSMVDFGFSPQFARFIAYSYAGADAILKEGVSSSSFNAAPNLLLMYKVLLASRRLYLGLACFVLFLLLSVGTVYVYSISEALPISEIMIAWFCYSIASFVNILYCYYSSFFKGIGDFVSLNQALLLSKLFQIVGTLVGLYWGGGLIAVAIAFLIAGVIFRLFLSFRYKLFTSAHQVYGNIGFDIGILQTVWHNSWKEGIIMLSRYLIIQANTILCSLYLNLSITASYALIVQILTIISSISFIHFTTKLPELNVARVNNQTVRMKCLLSKLWFSFVITYVSLVLLLYWLGVPLIEFFKPGVMLSNNLLLFVSLYMFLEANHSLFASYISTSNRLPYMIPYSVSAILGILLSIILLKYTNWGVWGIVFGQFIIQLLYNNWKWPYYVMKETGLSLNHLLVLGFRSFNFCYHG